VVVGKGESRPFLPAPLLRSCSLLANALLCFFEERLFEQFKSKPSPIDAMMCDFPLSNVLKSKIGEVFALLPCYTVTNGVREYYQPGAVIRFKKFDLRSWATSAINGRATNEEGYQFIL
jgi:hypothetical protein